MNAVKCTSVRVEDQGRTESNTSNLSELGPQAADSQYAKNTRHSPLCNAVEFIDRDPHWYKRSVKEVISHATSPRNINRDSEIDISEAWMPTIKKHNHRRRNVRQRTAEGTTHRNSEDRHAPISATENPTNHSGGDA